MRQQGRDARLRTQPGHGHTCAGERGEVGPGLPKCSWSRAWAEPAAPGGFQAPPVLSLPPQLLSILLPKWPGHQNELVAHFLQPLPMSGRAGESSGCSHGPQSIAASPGPCSLQRSPDLSSFQAGQTAARPQR